MITGSLPLEKIESGWRFNDYGVMSRFPGNCPSYFHSHIDWGQSSHVANKSSSSPNIYFSKMWYFLKFPWSDSYNIRAITNKLNNTFSNESSLFFWYLLLKS